MPTQDDVFSKSEGDNWFERNQSALADAEGAAANPVVMMLKNISDLKPKTIGDLGCSNGYLLHELSRHFGGRGVGIEPSAKAIADGQKAFSGLDFRKGTLNELPAKDGEFDLVVVSFVLTWVDRKTLLSSISEIDRVVAEGGYLAVSDFLPDYPQRRRYHHLPDAAMYTYKQDYSALFIATGWYAEAARATFEHCGRAFQADIESDRRCSVVLLRKSLERGYPIVG